MTAVDRDYLLKLLYDARQVQDSRAKLPAEKTTATRRLKAETRSYTLSLAIDAVNDGLVEQLHAETEQRIYTEVTIDQDRAWAAYMAGMGSAPESTEPVAIPVVDDSVDHFAPAAARRVFFATDQRVEQLAEAFWRLVTNGTAAAWRARDDRRDLQVQARDWLRAAVATGLLPPPPEPLEVPVDEWVPEEYVGPTGVGSSTPGGVL